MASAVSPALEGYQQVLDSRQALLEGATDDALRAHFQAEIDQIKTTIAAMQGGSSAYEPVPADAEAAPLLDSDDQATAGDETTDAPEEQLPIVRKQTEASDEGSKSGGSGSELSLPPQLEPYRQFFIDAAEQTGTPADLLASVAWKETRGDHEGTLTAGAIGLMQVDPSTFNSGPDSLAARHPELQGGDLSDPATNILAAAYELKDQYDAFGSWDLALRAYNSGPNNVNPDDLTDITMDDGRITGTANYVELVNAYRDIISTGKGQLVDDPDGMIAG